MKNNIQAKDVKENISLVDLLSRLGYEPKRSTGRNLTYISMVRDTDTIGSFFVEPKTNVWYDQGLPGGGSIIDFGLKYWPGLSFPDVLEKIVETSQAGPVAAVEFKRQAIAEREPHYGILDIRELGTNHVISDYLESRGIWHAAQGKLKEIYYYVDDQQQNRRNYSAAGWQNEKGGWELRSAGFKGCLGHKAVSYIPGDLNRMAVFEGYINYLSWLSDNPFAEHSVVVLNSISMLPEGIRLATGFPEIDLYFDNDGKGHETTAAFLTALPHAIDQYDIYEGYNDYNEKLIAENRQTGLSR
jgi:hypothetical protein